MPPTPEKVRPSDNFTDPYTTSEKYRNFDSLLILPPCYSQIAPSHVRGTSLTSTPRARQTGGTVNPRVEIEKKALKEEEKGDWKNKFKSLTSVVVFKTNEVMLKTLKEHDEYAKRSKDLMDKEMAEMRREIDSLKPIPQSDTIKPERVIVAVPASFGSHMLSADESTGRSNSNPHVNGTGNYEWIINQKW